MSGSPPTIRRPPVGAMGNRRLPVPSHTRASCACPWHLLARRTRTTNRTLVRGRFRMPLCFRAQRWLVTGPCGGGSPGRNAVSAATGIPYQWDVATKKNIKWVAPLGTQTYGGPVIAGGKIYVGTNNGGNFTAGDQGRQGLRPVPGRKDGQAALAGDARQAGQRGAERLAESRASRPRRSSRASASTTSATVASWFVPTPVASWTARTTARSGTRSTPSPRTPTSSGCST